MNGDTDWKARAELAEAVVARFREQAAKNRAHGTSELDWLDLLGETLAWKARAETAETTLVRIRTMDRQTVGVYDWSGRRYDFVVVSAYELDRVLGKVLPIDDYFTAAQGRANNGNENGSTRRDAPSRESVRS